ncbi:hypothetical protein BKK47_07230 [Rodentibacter mrazii]|uniref:DUF3577 domain-containing protein n=1 Tax=Rodentibacter mrazii TaxID=1908257 RepID=A0A1V3IFU8_9PAST|nr:STY4534 family ICE replication protein [Rodentibacter mrazii]OOF39157.1 hypothetical protein BKK47_07230 [Rodentibacter mrazii]
MSTQNNQQAKYFNLHTSGIGYLSDIREIKPTKGKKGDSYWACRIAALVGPADSAEYRVFDMNISGEETVQLIKRCQEAVEAKKKVLVSFVMGDLRYDTFTYSKDSEYHKKGDTGISLKGRLFRINFIKVDGELKYQLEKRQSAEQDN